MSVKNDIIALNEVVKQTTDLLKEQSTSWKSIVDEIKKINQSAPSSYIKMQKELADSIAKADQVEQRYQATLSKRTQLQNKINTDVQKILNTGSSLAKQQEKEIALEAKRQAQLEKSTNTYQKVQDRVRQLTQTYNDLATRQALGQKLDAQQLSQLAKLEGQLQAYDKILKQVDATVGKNQRNVGNYASGWNGLGNSINQITRELPAFTFSAQTGFLALSNNIPMLADEIKRVSDNVAEMRAKGQQVPGVMSQILTSFLSWQTALSLAVTLITVYGKEIGVLFDEMFQGSKKIDAAKIALTSYNEALKGGEYVDAYTKISKVNIAFNQAREGVISKEKALKIYNAELGDVMGTTNDFNKAEQTFINQSKNFVEASLARAQANILIAKSAELSIKNREISNNKEVSFMEQVSAFVKSGRPFSKLFDPLGNKVLDERSKAFNNNAKEIEANNKEAEKLMKNFSDLSKNLNFDKPDKKEKKKKDTTEKDRLEALRQQYEHQVSIFNLMEDGVDKEIRLLDAHYKYQNELDKGNKIKLLTNTNEYLAKLNKLVSDAKKEEEDKKKKADDEFLKEQEELFKEDERLTKEYNDDKQAWKDKADAEYLKSEQEKTDEYLRQVDRIKDYISQGMDLGNFGFSSLNIFTQMEENGKTAFENMIKNAQGWKEEMAIITQAVGDVLRDVFNQMEERQNAYYERQFANLDKEKEVALQFAGESATGREAIERQYEEKKVALQREQVKKQKQIAIFSAIINIAQGITASLAQGGPAGIILAALVGVLGAVQIASIANTPLPAFEKGTSNAPQGWAITQEKGAEMITDKNGNIKTLGNNKGNQLTYLNKGDKVYTADETTKRINEMLLGTGVAPIVSTNFSSGLTKDEMLEVMHQTLSKQPKTSVVFDQYGYNLYQEKKNSRTNLKNRNAKI